MTIFYLRRTYWRYFHLWIQITRLNDIFIIFQVLSTKSVIMFILYCDSVTRVARATTDILPDMYLSHRICIPHTSYCWLADYRSLYILHCLLMAFWLPVGPRSLKTLLILVVLEKLSITVCTITLTDGGFRRS